MRNARSCGSSSVLGGVEDADGFVGEDGAGVHANDAAAEVVDDFAVVGGHEGGDAVAVDFEQQAHDLARVRGVDAVGGLVAEQDIGLGNDGAGEGDLALFAAGELPGEPLGLVGQGHAIEYLVDRQVNFAIGAPTDLERQAHVLADGGVGQQAGVLKNDPDAAAKFGEGGAANPGHVDAVDEDDAGIEGLFAQEDAKQGGLARAVRPDEKGELAAGDGDRDVGERGLAVVALGDSLDDDQRRAPIRRGSGGRRRSSRYCRPPARPAR